MSSAEETGVTKERPAIDVDELVAQADSGSRNPLGTAGFLLAAIAFVWSVF